MGDPPTWPNMDHTNLEITGNVTQYNVREHHRGTDLWTDYTVTDQFKFAFCEGCESAECVHAKFVEAF